MKTKRRLNIKGLIALIIWIGAIGLLIHDFILLMQGYCYTWYGITTLAAALLAGSMAEDYMHARIEKQ